MVAKLVEDDDDDDELNTRRVVALGEAECTAERKAVNILPSIRAVMECESRCVSPN